MRYVAAVVFTLMLSGTQPAVQIDSSIVAMQIPGLDGKMRTFCSGVVAQTVPVAYVITEAHCVDEDVEKARIDGLAVTEVARSHDVVLLRVQGWLAKHAPARVAERDPVVGSRVRAVGRAFGKFVAVTEGIVSAEYADELYLDMQCVRGMSGGPIVNEAGYVVSLVRAFQTDGGPADPSPNGFTIGPSTRYLRDLFVVMRAFDGGR